MSREILAEKIRFELGLIERELLETTPLFVKILASRPDGVELRAIAAVLHSFYNGIEKILLFIAKDIDDEIHSDERWHKTLLARMATSSEKRGIVLSKECVHDLQKYLSFRHYFRHSYGMTLDWELIEPLCKSIDDVYSVFKDSIIHFIDSMDE